MTKIFQCCLPLILLFSASIVSAEIYTWVDEDGKTHYSDKPEHVGDSKAEAMELEVPNILSGNGVQENKVVEKEDQEEKTTDKKGNSKKTEKTKAAWQGDGADTDEKRCALAQAISNGGAKHANGADIDAHDKEVAERDISKYCH